MAQECAGFESYLRGSWWDVQVREQRSDKVLVSYNAAKDEEWAWVSMTELRFRSRKADSWDCYIIKKGIDLSVCLKHPHINTLNLEKEGCYDARVSSVKGSDHAPGSCSCKFYIQYFDVKMDAYTDGSLLDRILLTNLPETEVSISSIRILQQGAESIPFLDVLGAHMERMWIPLGRGCIDAYCLTHADLCFTRKPQRAYVEDNTSPTNLRFGEVFESNCNSPVDGNETEVLDSRQSPDRPREEQTIPKSTSGALNNQEQKTSAECTDVKSPMSVNFKRKFVLAQDGKEDRFNPMVETPPRKRGRPRRDCGGLGPVTEKPTQIQARKTRKRAHKNAKVKTEPQVDTDSQGRHSEKTMHTTEVEDDRQQRQAEKIPRVIEDESDHGRRHEDKRTRLVEDDDELESSGNSDSEGEWKPGGGIKVPLPNPCITRAGIAKLA